MEGGREQGNQEQTGPGAIGIYLHIPFCSRRCDYCDFFVEVAGSPPGGFLDDLVADLRASAQWLAEQDNGAGPPRADTLYFGGGTPSLVPPEMIARVVEECTRLFLLEGGVEVTIEANPESVTPQRAAAWLAGGVNRLSLGVQSLDDQVLRPRGRVYTAAQALESGKAAREAGIANLNVDLIAGLPGETAGGFLSGLDRVIEEMSPDHLSIYLIETDDAGKDTPLARAVREGRESLGDDEEIVAMYGGAVDRLGAAGYLHYEISNFCLPSRASRHNLKYWRSHPYLGVGPSAHSYLARRRYGRPADMARWSRWAREGEVRADEHDYTLPSDQARAKEALVLEMRLREGVDLAQFRDRWGYDPARELAREISDMENAGLVLREAGRLALTRHGLLLSNEVFVRLQ